jgi:hypothetical protein
MKKLLLFILVFLGFASFSFGASYNISYTTNDDGQFNINFAGVVPVGQTFTTAGSGSPTQFSVKLYKTGATGSIQWSFRTANSSGHPRSTRLCAVNQSVASITSSSPGAWYPITITGCPSLNTTTKYALVGEALYLTAGLVSWRGDQSLSVYSGGNAYTPLSTSYPDMDTMFSIVITSPSPTFNNIKINGTTLTTDSYWKTNKLLVVTNVSQNANQTYYLRHYTNGTLISSSQFATNQKIGYVNITQGDGKYKLSFQAKNINGTTNTANYTVILDTTAPTITNNMPTGDLFSYLLKPLNSYVSCSDTNPYQCNISSSGNMKNVTATNNITYTTNGNKTYTLIAKDRAGNIATTSGTFRVNPYQYFRFYDTLRAIYTSSYTVKNNTRIYNSSGNYIRIPVYDLGLGTHKLFYNKSGYQSQAFSTTFNTTSNLNTTFNVNPVRLLLKVYSETSPTTQLKFNITIANATTSTQYLNQMNFSKYYNETLHGELSLSVTSTGYNQRKIFVTLLSNTVSNNTMYLLRTGSSNYPVIYRALQGSGGSASTIPIEDVTLSFYKTISGTRTFLGQAMTDNNGYTYFNMNYTRGDYEVIFQKTGFVTETLFTLPNVQEYTIYMNIEAAEVLNNLEDFDYAFYPSSQFVSKPFVGGVTLTASNNDLSSWRFKITGNTTIDYTSTASNGGSIYYNITNKSPTYTYNLTFIKNGIPYTFIKVYNNKNISLTNSTSWEVLAQNLNNGDYNGEKILIVLFVYIMIVGLGIFLSAGNQAVGIVLGIMPLTAFMLVDWISIPLYSILMLISILGAYSTRGGQ